MVAAIAGEELTKRYGHTNVVDRVSLRVEPGEIYGFLGLDGAGTTEHPRRRRHCRRCLPHHRHLVEHRRPVVTTPNKDDVEM